MNTFSRAAAATLICGFLFGLAPAWADQTYFVIKSGAKEFAVTEEVIAKAGEVEFKSALTDQDEDMHTVRGPRIRDLLALAGFSGDTIAAKAADGYEAKIPSSDVTTYDVITAVRVDGEPITEDENGPARIAYPVEDNPTLKGDDNIAARGVFQLKELTVE